MMINLITAVKAIQAGDVVAIPTETVYGLAADAFNLTAVEKTFELKGRPSDNPLIVHICSSDQLELLADQVPQIAYRLADSFWPGPLTLVLNKLPRVPDVVTGGLKTVAVRMPDHPLALELIKQTGPLTAPSGNKSGKPSPTKASHLIDDYGGKLPILDGGTCTIGLESTVLDLTQKTPKILRPGAIDAADIFQKTGIQVDEHATKPHDQIKSPGTRYSHYKPNAKVEWIETIPASFNSDCYYILHSTTPTVSGPNIIHYHGNFEKLAQNLYDHFRTADHHSYQNIRIEILPSSQNSYLIDALFDRISKAIG